MYLNFNEPNIKQFMPQQQIKTDETETTISIPRSIVDKQVIANKKHQNKSNSLKIFDELNIVSQTLYEAINSYSSFEIMQNEGLNEEEIDDEIRHTDISYSFKKQNKLGKTLLAYFRQKYNQPNMRWNTVAKFNQNICIENENKSVYFMAKQFGEKNYILDKNLFNGNGNGSELNNFLKFTKLNNRKDV